LIDWQVAQLLTGRATNFFLDRNRPCVHPIDFRLYNFSGHLIAAQTLIRSTSCSFLSSKNWYRGRDISSAVSLLYGTIRNGAIFLCHPSIIFS